MKSINELSVIMAVYKESENELKSSIESILNQSYKNFEYIIVVDNPDEKWRIDLINSYNDKRINLLINKKNMGLVYSLNRALKVAKGKYIARMDADDISNLDRFEKQIKYLTNNNLDLCGSQFETFLDDKKLDIISNPTNPDDIKDMLKYGTCVAHPSWFGTKDLFSKLDGYRNIPSCEDYDFLTRASLNSFRIGNCNEVLLNYRLSPKSISRSNPGKQEVIANYIRSKYRKELYFTMDDFEAYLNSKKYIKDLNRYNKFLNKISNIKSCNNKILKFIYCFTLIPNVNYIYRRMIVNYKRKKYVK